MPKDVNITDVSNLVQDISALYLNENFSDVAFIIGGEKLHAHKMILGARSAYFKALLYGGLEESSQSEIKITDVSPDAFRKLLKYVYTGTMSIEPSNLGLTLEVLGLAHKYLFTALLYSIINKLVTILNLENVYAILNLANLYELCDLRDACHNFMDKHASEVLLEDGFNELTQTSVIKLLQRDSFFAPEIEIFKGISKWCEANNDVANMVVQCVRLSWLTVVEIMSVVWPSKLVDNEILLRSISENVDVKSRKSLCRAQLLIDENVATPEHKTEVISGSNTTYLLNGNRDLNKYACHNTGGDQNGITIKLGSPSFINHIQMMLYDYDDRSYCYYIEVSIDERKWKRVIDYRHCSCRSYQNLYFEEEIVQYIRVVGTRNTLNDSFHLVYFEAYYRTSIPKTINGIVCPTTNAATLDKKAAVIEGSYPTALLDGDTKNYDERRGYTYHSIGSGAIVVQLAQPYIISSLKLLLWDKAARFYNYYIESSLNKTDWEMIVDRRDEECSSWQICRFDERPVVYIRIRGTHDSFNENSFYCVHLECPAPASDTN